MGTPLRVLIAEDRPADAELIVHELRRVGFDPDWVRVDTENNYVAQLSESVELILADHSMPEFDSGRALQLLQDRGLDIPLIVVTGSIGEEKAVELIRKGASDYLLKDRLTRLGEAARRVLAEKQLRQERRRAELALSESESSFRLLFVANPQPMWVVDSETNRFLEVNNAAISRYGYSREEFLAMAVADLLVAGDGQDPAPDYGEGRTTAENRRHHLKNGDIIDVEVVSHPLRFTGHEARLVVAHDMTARNRAEAAERAANEAMQLQNQRLSALYKAGQIVNSTLEIDQILGYLATESMRVTKATHVLVFIANTVKHVFEKRFMHGFSAEDVAKLEKLQLHLDEGLNGLAYRTRDVVRVDDVATRPEYHDLVSGTRSELVIPIIWQGEVLGNIDLESPEVGAFRDVDMEYLKALGEQAAMAISNARLFDELKSYGEFLEQAVKERTQELENTKDRVETILGSVGDALMVLRKDGRIEQVNQAFERQTGYTIAEAELRDHHDLLHLDFGSKGDYQARLELITPDDPWHGETTVQRKDGTLYDAAMTVAPVRNPQGKIQLLVASIRDITPLKEVERAKDEFVSNVSHELRTPITSLRLTRDLMKRDPSRMDVFMERLNRDMERLNLLIEDLLRLSRLQQGTLELNLQPLDLNTLVTQYAEDRAPLAESRGLTLRRETTPDLPLVQADEGLLSQALSVLLTNALNYTPSGGTVTLSTGERSEGHRRWAGFCISDTGPGISPSEIPQLFTRFFRGSVGRSSSAAGTGLGLSIAKEIVNRHIGRIEVVSEGIPGKGVAFFVWLPVNTALATHKDEP